MNDKTLKDILNQIENMGDLKSQDIPSLDLYMDQIMTLFDVHLADHKRYPDDKLLTKTMINNYSKERLLKPIKGKKYSKEHILQMLIIYSLKNTISIQEIKTVLQPFHEHEQSLEPLYEHFITVKKQLSKDVTHTIQKIIDEQKIDLDDSSQLLLLLLWVCSLSQQYQMIAEKILDTFYKQED